MRRIFVMFHIASMHVAKINRTTRSGTHHLAVVGIWGQLTVFSPTLGDLFDDFEHSIGSGLPDD